MESTEGHIGRLTCKKHFTSTPNHLGLNGALAEDTELLSRCVAGDRKAGEILVRRFSNLVYKTIQHCLIFKFVSFGQYDLEALHNRVFLCLFEDHCRGLRQFQGKNGCSLASWIKMAAIRIVLNHLKKKGIEPFPAQSWRIPLNEQADPGGDQPAPLSPLETAEQERLLAIAIYSLPVRERLFFKLHFERNVPLYEVARIMGLSMDNAYTLKYRIKDKLRDSLALYLENGDTCKPSYRVFMTAR